MKRLIGMMIAFAMISVSCNQKNNNELISAPEFEKLISDQAIQIVDARTPQEYDESHIENAVNIDVENLNYDKEIMALDMDMPIAIYHRNEKWSKMAADKLRALGYKVYELEGGYLNWQKNHYDEIIP